MSLEARIAVWQFITAVATYAVYLWLLFDRAGDGPLADTPYGDLVAWTIGGGLVITIIGSIALGIAAGRSGRRSDMRDKQIGRIADAVGASFVTIGGVAALILAILEVDHFWIGNVIYLAFLLSGLLSSAVRIAMHRFGVPSW